MFSCLSMVFFHAAKRLCACGGLKVWVDVFTCGCGGFHAANSLCGCGGLRVWVDVFNCGWRGFHAPKRLCGCGGFSFWVNFFMCWGFSCRQEVVWVWGVEGRRLRHCSSDQ